MHDDGLGGNNGSGVVRFAALLVAGVILALGLLQDRPNADAIWLVALAASAPCFALLLWPRLPRDLPTFNRTVVRLGTLLVVAFLLQVTKALGWNPEPGSTDFVAHVPQALVLLAGNLALIAGVVTLLRNAGRRERLAESAQEPEEERAIVVAH